MSPKHIKCSALDPVSDGTSNVSGALIKHVTAYQVPMFWLHLCRAVPCRAGPCRVCHAEAYAAFGLKSPAS